MNDTTPASGVNDLALPMIIQPYLLVLFSVPIHIDAAGRRWLEPLWAKDLIAHTAYLADLTLVARVALGPDVPVPAGAVPIDAVEALFRVRFVEVPMPRSGIEALRQLPRTAWVVWRELGRARIVHTSVAAWPIPEAWLVAPMVWLRRRLLYINVESAFWRLAPGATSTFGQRWRASVFETLNRVCMRRADLTTFTHAGYLNSLLGSRAARGHVVEASWIDDERLLSDAELHLAMARRHRKGLRLVFAGRINREKGILVLIEAVARCVRDGLQLSLDVYGDGPMMPASAVLADELAVTQAIRFHGSVPYDSRFFEALREFDVLAVPSLTDEQPRIVFDAYSQGLPVIASETEGLVQCVQDGVTGLLFEPGKVAALHALLSKVAGAPRLLSDLSAASLQRARSLTHREMHRKRWRLLLDAFPELARDVGAPSPKPANQPVDQPRSS